MKFKLLLSLLLNALLLAGCYKEVDEVVCGDATGGTSTTITNTSTIATFVRRNQVPTQTYSFLLSQGATITTAKGNRIFIPPNAFTAVGGPVTSAQAQLQVREIVNRPEMVLSAMPTVSGGQLLDSGGEYYLKVMQGNNRLRLKPASRINMQMRAGPIVPGMSLFFAQITQGVVNWLPQSPRDTISSIRITSDSANFQVRPFYNIILNNDSLGWINIDRFLQVPTRTTVAVNVPADDVNRLNTAVYLVFNTSNSVLNGGTYSTVNQLSFSNIPVDFDVTAVVVRLVNGQYYFGKQQARVGANQQYSPPLRAVTEAELLTEIRRL